MDYSKSSKLRYSQMSILIVEDDEDDFIILEDLLHEALGLVGHIEWAASFDNAQDKIHQQHYDLYFVDNHLGAELGLSLISSIKDQFEAAPPIIMLSGINDHQTDLQAMDLGADDYLIKSDLNSQLLERTVRYTTKSKQLESRLVKLAHFDSLTGLHNRSVFNELLLDAIEQSARSNQQFALITLDIDHFKKINDNYGHPAGDWLLVKVAHRLKKAIRRSDVIARLGGDEFSIILKNVEQQSDYLHLVESVRQVIEMPFNIDEVQINASVSIGVAIYPDDSMSADELVNYSDMAMYQTKHQGRNGYSFYNQSLHQQARYKHDLENRLKQALLNDNLELYYQPIICLNTGDVISYEALLRWPDENGGFHNTEQFVTIAEESLLIVELGDWVFEHACKQLLLWQQQGQHRNVSINVSSKQFNTDAFTNSVKQYLKLRPSIADKLTFELTERRPLDLTVDNIRRLDELSALGIKFSIDDFGIGHSSFAYIRALPMNVLKIDKSITDRIIDSKADNALCKAIIAMSDALELSVVAEGVETLAIANCLRQLKCHSVQGYYYARPLAANKVEQWQQDFSHSPEKHK